MTAPDQLVNLVDHARTELERLGEFNPGAGDPAYAQSLVAAVAAFASFDGHSGGSNDIAVDTLGRLLAREQLTPLTSDPAEWIDRTQISNLSDGHTLWQSTRNPKAFTDDQAATFWLVDDPAEDRTQVTRYPTTQPGTPPWDLVDVNPLPAPVGVFEPCTRTKLADPMGEPQ